MQVQPTQAPRVTTPHIGALLLIAVGALMLVGNLTGGQLAGGLVVLAIGLAFATAYALGRKYGFLVPGGIMTGLGAAILIGQAAQVSDNDMGIFAVFGLGVGFALIYVVDAIVTGSLNRFWPAIPAAIMFLVAGGLTSGNEGVVKSLGIWSPVILVVIGVWLLFVRSRPKTT